MRSKDEILADIENVRLETLAKRVLMTKAYEEIEILKNKREEYAQEYFECLTESEKYVLNSKFFQDGV